MLAAALDTGEPELAIREESAYGRRLTRPADGLVRPDGGGPWRLDTTERGTLDTLALVPCPRRRRRSRPGRSGSRSGRPG